MIKCVWLSKPYQAQQYEFIKERKFMKRIVTFVLCIAIVASFALTASARNPINSDYVVLQVTQNTERIDNSATNHQSGDHEFIYHQLFGTGYTTEGDAIKYSDVVLEKPVTKLGLKFGYNPGADKPQDTSTEYAVYVNKIEGDPIATFEVFANETPSSKIVDQIYKYADVTIDPGTYSFYVVSISENSGSFSEFALIYEGSTFSELWSVMPEPKEDEPEEEEPKEEAPVETPEDVNKDESPAEDNEPVDAPAENAGVSPILWIIIAVVVIAAIAVVVLTSKKKKA